MRLIRGGKAWLATRDGIETESVRDSPEADRQSPSVDSLSGSGARESTRSEIPGSRRSSSIFHAIGHESHSPSSCGIPLSIDSSIAPSMDPGGASTAVTRARV